MLDIQMVALPVLEVAQPSYLIQLIIARRNQEFPGMVC